MWNEDTNEDWTDYEKFLDEDDQYRVWLDEQYQGLLDEFEGMLANDEYTLC